MADKDPRAQALKDSQRRSEEDTKAAEERQSYQPTPTQEENDRAKLGIESLEELDDKEPDGSPEERSTAGAGGAAYSTRAATPKK